MNNETRTEFAKVIINKIIDNYAYDISIENIFEDVLEAYGWLKDCTDKDKNFILNMVNSKTVECRKCGYIINDEDAVDGICADCYEDEMFLEFQPLKF